MPGEAFLPGGHFRLLQRRRRRRVLSMSSRSDAVAHNKENKRDVHMETDEKKHWHKSTRDRAEKSTSTRFGVPN